MQKAGVISFWLYRRRNWIHLLGQSPSTRKLSVVDTVHWPRPVAPSGCATSV